MSKVFSTEEQLTWSQGLPAKRTGALMILVNDNGEVLFEDPSYKEHWILPGGVVEENESPLAAAVREVQEELGLELDAATVSYKGTVYIPKHASSLDFLNIYFKASISNEMIEQIRLRDEEILDYKFLPPSELAKYMPEYLANAIKALLEEETPVYFDDQLMLKK